MIFSGRKPAEIVRKIFLLTLSAGLLFLFTSCEVTLRDVEKTHTPKVEESEKETEKNEPSYDFTPPETEEKYEAPTRVISAEAEDWIRWYEDTYGAGSADTVLLGRDEIRTLNKKMINDVAGMRDMTTLPDTMAGTEVREMIERYNLPSDERYTDGGTLITDDMREEVRQNRNLDAIPDTVTLRRAVITGRSDLKGFPTDKAFHKHGDRHYDGIQETELISGFPAAVLHSSADGEFSFVISYFYSGWIPSPNVAYCTDEEYMMFASPEDYVTVISKTVECGGIRFDMGAVLPYVSEDSDSYTVLVPKRRDDTGMLFLEEAVISKSDSVHGSLDYTMKNYYAQAFMYLGTTYGWGGSDGGVDCSGFVCSVFRTFGIYLPRNTSEQSSYAGTVLSLENDPAGVLDSIAQPAAVYRPGHVMLYLGKRDGEYYIIHAPQGGEQVSVAKLSMSRLTGVSIFS